MRIQLNTNTHTGHTTKSTGNWVTNSLARKEAYTVQSLDVFCPGNTYQTEKDNREAQILIKILDSQGWGSKIFVAETGKVGMPYKLVWKTGTV